MDRIRLGDACEILNGYAFRSENYVESGIRVIRISNVQKGYIEDNTPAYYPLDSNGLDRFMLEEGDLLMSLTGNVGRVAILEKKFLPAALNQRVACLRLKSDKLSKRYLFHILNSDFFEQQCILSSKGVAQKNMSTEWLKQDVADEVYFIEHFKMQLADIKAKIASGSAQPQLPISTMNKIQILIPEIEQQREFAAFVDQTNKSKMTIQKSLDKLETLKKALMQKYFG